MPQAVTPDRRPRAGSRRPRSTCAPIALSAVLAASGAQLVACDGDGGDLSPAPTQPASTDGPTEAPTASETQGPEETADPTEGETPRETAEPPTGAETEEPPTEGATPEPPTGEDTPATTGTPPAEETPTPAAPVCPPAAPEDLSLEALQDRFVDEIYPLMTRSTGGCMTCHSSTTALPMAMGTDGPDTFEGLYADGYLDDGEDTLLDRLTRPAGTSGAMPMGGPAWSKAEQATLACFVADLSTLEDGGEESPGPVDRCALPQDPGHKILHRLNRAEYNNTVRDLLLDAGRPADGFPVDDRGYGYDNVAEVLSIAPILVEKYDAAAAGLVERAMGIIPPFGEQYWEAETLEDQTSGVPSGNYWRLTSNGAIVQPYDAEYGGRYRISARAYQEAAGPDPARMAFQVDGVDAAVVDVVALEDDPQEYATEVELTAGSHVLGFAFINDYFNLRGPPGGRDRNLDIDWIKIEGPIDPDPLPTEARPGIMVCDPAPGEEDACARQILSAFGRRAWRRPLAADEVTRLLALVHLALDQGDDFEQGIRNALHAILLSPHFVFRVELDPDPTSAEPHPLSDHELASRLSYFLWSSTPDGALLDLADQGRLSDPSVLQAQVARMLDDPRSAALADNFAGQWLYTRGMAEVQPDPVLFPDFDDGLRRSMAAETRAFFWTFLREDLSLLDMLDADFTYLDDRLATHYGLAPVGSSEVVRVDLPPGERGGFLTQGTYLTVTSHPDVTSAVLRGKWVMTQLLCEPPPPPPSNVPGIDETEVDPDSSQREQMEQHRADPYCASCHAVMDPIGFGLDNFDAIGRWRTVDDFGQPIDATGTLPDGRTFDGHAELAEILKADPAVPACAVQQLFTYALGRGVQDADDCAVDAITGGFGASGHRLPELVRMITASEPFRMRRGEPTEGE